MPKNLARFITVKEDGFSILEAPNLAEESEDGNEAFNSTSDKLQVDLTGTAKDILKRICLRGQIS